MIDILYLAHGRRMFTEISFGALVMNTNWNRARLVIYTDGGDFNPAGVFGQKLPEIPFVLSQAPHGGPVAIMNHFLGIRDGVSLCGGPPVNRAFAKIDNDVMVPPGWLDRCLEAMGLHPELDLLGIEPPSSTVRIDLSKTRGLYAQTDAIGGIGLMRRLAFEGREPMRPHSIYGGFTDWQLRHPEVNKGWLVPPLNLFLLDRLPLSPWQDLSKRYIAEGQQRPWKNYSPQDAHLWRWWQPANYACGGVVKDQPYIVGEQ